MPTPSHADSPDDNPLRLPVRQIQGELRIIGGGHEPVTLFLSPRSELHGGIETVDEFLNKKRPFLPVQTAEKRHALVNRESIIRVDVSGDPPVSADMEEAPFTTVEFVRLEVEGGEVLEGVIQSRLPDEHSRVSDFFNTGEMFIPLGISTGLTFVNVKRILRVIL